MDSEAFAKYMDINDPLKGFRAKFQYPKKKELPIGEQAVLLERNLRRRSI